MCAALLLPAAAVAVPASLPLSCHPDAVALWQAAGPDPGNRFGAGLLPGIVLGPPGGSGASTGSVSVASLGHQGSVTLAFTSIIIEDGPGPDFIVFENPFFIGAAPANDGDPYFIFAEPGRVEVSADGVQWHLFPFDGAALAAASGSPVSAALFPDLVGLAGVTPTFAGVWNVANVPLFWDAAGTGGVSGAGGDAFDLATVGLSEVSYLRLTDADSRNGAAGAAEGFDLDGVVVLHGRPVQRPGLDSDGDRIADAEELLLYGTLPGAADSDADGVDDGREIASCRDPLVSGVGALPPPLAEPRLWLTGAACTGIRWTFMGSGQVHDVVRGEVASLSQGSGSVDLGSVTCLADDRASVAWSCDAAEPPPGSAFFYLVRLDGQTLGRSSSLWPRQATGGCP